MTEDKRVIVYRKKSRGNMTAFWRSYPGNRVPLGEGDSFIMRNVTKPERPLNVATLPLGDGE